MESMISKWNYKSIKFGYYYFRKMPRKLKGVYIIWCREKNVCVYVGKAKEQPIQKRLMDHWSSSHNDILSCWVKAFGKHLEVCYKELDTIKIDGLEKRLIKCWKPEANIIYNPNSK